MKPILLTFIVFATFHCVGVAQASGVYGPVVIEEGDTYDKIEAYDPPPWWPPEWGPTIVDMTGGHVGIEDNPTSGMFTYESSTLNMSGGTIDYLHTFNSSKANISGGLVSHYGCWATQTITANDYSTINLYDGAFLFGGSFHIFDLYDSSTLNVYGGDVGLFLMAYNSSTINIYNGYFWPGVHLYDYSTINVYGGYIDFYTDGNIPATATVNIYGYSFNYNPQGEWRGWEDPCCGWWVSKLTGFGADGTAITYWGLPDPSTYSNINLIPDFVLCRGVDLADFAAFASVWRSRNGDADWNPIYDISDPNDDVIDERDLAVLTKYWLEGVK